MMQYPLTGGNLTCGLFNTRVLPRICNIQFTLGVKLCIETENFCEPSAQTARVNYVVNISTKQPNYIFRLERGTFLCVYEGDEVHNTGVS
jgi:hypothetical protein